LLVHLTAAIYPAAHVLDHLGEALRDDLADTEQVAWEHPARWRIRLANFGMVVREDAVRVSESLTERMAGLGAPTLRLEEVRPLPIDGDDSVWVGLGGDADVLSELASAIPRWAHEIGFVPDRRSYYSGIRLGRVTATTTVPYLESLASRLGGYEGPAWTARDLLLGVEKLASPDHPPRFDVFQQIPFAGKPIGSGGAHVEPVRGQQT
jgi:2'-5' RNA ligase